MAKYNWMDKEQLKNYNGGKLNKVVEDAYKAMQLLIKHKKEQVESTMEKMQKMDKMFKQMQGEN